MERERITMKTLSLGRRIKNKNPQGGKQRLRTSALEETVESTTSVSVVSQMKERQLEKWSDGAG